MNTRISEKFDHLLQAGMLLCLTTSTCFAVEDIMPTITATPHKTVCTSSSLDLDNIAVTGQLCVSQGSFSPDKYVVRFNDSVVLQGIDDQTTAGMSSTYQDKAIALKCTPQLVPGNATADDVRRIVPTILNRKSPAWSI